MSDTDPDDRRGEPRADVPPQIHTLPTDRVKARRTTALAVMSAGLAVSLLVGALGLVILDRRSTERTNGQRIDALVDQVENLTDVVTDLTEQLADARARIDAAAAEDDVVESCERKLTANSRTASRDVNVGVARLVIVISTVLPEDRATAIGATVSDLQAAVGRYDDATETINAWQRLPIDQQRRLPCPAE